MTEKDEKWSENFPLAAPDAGAITSSDTPSIRLHTRPYEPPMVIKVRDIMARTDRVNIEIGNAYGGLQKIMLDNMVKNTIQIFDEHGFIPAALWLDDDIGPHDMRGDER